MKKSILNKITFGLFFKETQKAEITATDEGSGVNKYYYYVDKSGSEDKINAILESKYYKKNENKLAFDLIIPKKTLALIKSAAGIF